MPDLHPPWGRGPVLESYAETGALERMCPNCHAPVGEFCVHDGGTQRRIPCPKRMKAQEAK
jgi:hypothetical protein